MLFAVFGHFDTFPDLSVGGEKPRIKTNLAFLNLAVFGHFDTFPDGWLDGEKSRIKTNLAKLKLKLRLCLATSWG